jgi:hypothetical protein
MLEGENATETSETQNTEQTPASTEITPPIDAATVLKNLETFKQTELGSERRARLAAEDRARKAEEQLELARQNTVATQPSKEESSQAFFQKPHEETRNIVRDELKKVAGPLIDELRADRKESAYDKIKLKFKSHPKVGDLVSTYEDLVDQAMQGVDPTDQNMLAAITQVSGLINLEMVPKRTSTTEKPKVSETPKVLPSSLPASSPPPPAPKSSESKQPEITETDRAAMKIYGWNVNDPASVADYFAFKNHDGDVDSLLEIGKKK